VIFFFRDENLGFAACPYLPSEQNLWIFYKMILVKSSSSTVPLSPPTSNSSRHATVSSSHHAALLSSHCAGWLLFCPLLHRHLVLLSSSHCATLVLSHRAGWLLCCLSLRRHPVVLSRGTLILSSSSHCTTLSLS
jgi:hypothetical protein